MIAASQSKSGRRHWRHADCGYSRTAVIDLVTRLRKSGKLAPKTIYNIYANLEAVFRDAQIAHLIDASPCVLTKYQLGENADKDSEWRATALFNRFELERLISDPRVPLDRRVQYALEGIAAQELAKPSMCAGVTTTPRKSRSASC